MIRIVRTVVGVITGAIVCGCSTGRHGSAPTPTPTVSPSPTPTPAACANPATQRVYALDVAGELFSFDPTAVAGTAHGFTRIGTLACSAGSALPPFTDPATPYSISVDDSARAWVLYTSGELFLVSTSSASCAASSFVPSQMTGGATWSLFGAAFSTDSTASPAERMWISGGATDGTLGHLGKVDPSTLAVTTVGTIGGGNALRPDLTGLSDATLWGFFPNPNGTSAVQQIDKTSGALVGSPFAMTTTGMDAWAVAHWGGQFYLFVSTTQGMTSNETIRKIDRATGSQSTLAQNLPFTIVAAASSTCAPIVGP